MGRTRKPILVLIISLVILMLSGIGDFRSVGFMMFIYVGLPWYILVVKDKAEDRVALKNTNAKKFRLYSVTLLVFGLICVILGVAIDLFVLYEIYSKPFSTATTNGLFRLLYGLPFFGFGIFLLYLSFGKIKN